jgi:hypothetical protein
MAKSICVNMIEMNFPLFKTFKVSRLFTSFLNRKFDEYKKDHESYNVEKNTFDESRGYQSKNLLTWDNKQFKNFTDRKLKRLISSHLNVRQSQVSYHWVHFLDYETGGSMRYHNHLHNEDFVLFIYLKNCKTGNTVFHLNDYNSEYAYRTQFEIQPQRGRSAIFSSYLMHRGDHTNENKRIFVVGIKVDLRK